MRLPWIALVLTASLFVSWASGAAELHVISSGGFAAALKVLAPAYEAKTRNKLVLGWVSLNGRNA